MLYLDPSFLDNYYPPEFKSQNIRSFQPKDAQVQLNRSMIRYHYTSANALMAILNTGKNGPGAIRFTDSRYMNDRSEHLFFIKQLIEYLAKNKDLFPFCQKVVDHLLLKRHAPEDYISLRVLELEGTELDPFIYTNSRHFLFCLSRDSDSLHMWNYYIRNGNYQGYNIGININEFLKSFDTGELTERTNPIKLYCGDVLYSQKKQEDEIEILCKTIENIGTESADQPLSLQLGMAHLWAYIECYGLFFKDASFSDEKEYRIVIQFEEPLAGSAISSYFKAKESTSIEYTFFERNGILVPCLNVPLAKGAVKRITMAPILESQIASDSIKEFLCSNEYENVEVKQSRIPIRY